MLGFLLRRLPFWVREPVLIVLGCVFGVRIMYLAIHEQNGVAAAIGAVFLVGTAIRIHVVVRALRARRSLTPAEADALPQPHTQTSPPAQTSLPAQTSASAPASFPAQVAPLPPSPAVVVPSLPEKEPNAWGQAVAAVAVFGALAAALWLGPRMLPSDDNSTSQAVSCPSGEHEKLPKAYIKTPKAVTGEQLCKALHRPDLAQLLGTPDETATTASGSNNTALLTGGKVAQPEAEIKFDTYTVHFSATYNHLTTAQYVKLMETGGQDNKPLTVLGRPAVFSSDHTMQFELRFGGEGSSSPAEEGPLARTLSVALDQKDRGGYYELSVWSGTGALPDDSVLLDIAKKVLPAIPERAAR